MSARLAGTGTTVRPLWLAMEELQMPKYIAIGYGDQAGYDRTPQNIREAAHHHDASLKQRGVMMGIAETPIQVRNPNGSGVLTQTGPYLSSDLPIAGFSIMEAKDINEAIEFASKSPCAVAHGVIEIWPLKEQ
ncbi:YciI family protein [Sinorhizobium fredii]|nr:YciI family protein [Sinorhizobium fredii]